MRICKYKTVSEYLSALNDNELLMLLKQGELLQPLHSNWGTKLKLEIEGVPVFVKQVPLNEIEGKLQNIKSTENLFNLPVYYQYGVGSGGFNVWREVLAHEKTTEWVLAGESQNFPLMYHWRILEDFQEKQSWNEDEFNNYVAYWENSSAIGERVKANHQASTNVVIFIEYIPETLKKWLDKESKKGNAALDRAIGMVEQNLQETTLFLSRKTMLHFDAHFQNILTDGERLYFTDFGLTISPEFSLSKEEVQFYLTHSDYDRYYVITKLANWIAANSFGKDSVDEVLLAYAKGSKPDLLPNTLTPFLSSILKRDASLALKMNNFFELLLKHSKETSYPKSDLDRIWSETSAKPQNVDINQKLQEEP